ncbi:MAG TPA: DUF177 domain-containing protein [Thermoanaerobaculia bacterium]|nr:DUF177 domain-containing protein [Thermoanaerobaculia bacterium]
MSGSRDIILFDEIDKDGPQSYGRTLSIAPQDLGREEVVGISPVTITAHAEKGDLPGEYRIDGTCSFTGDLACSRCLEPSPFASQSSFHLRFEPRSELPHAEEEEVAVPSGELDVEFYTERAVPLRDLALEQIQLSIPMKPLCDESCLGLCPVCGANRNRETCSCGEPAIDERWGALREIQTKLKKRES